MEQYISIGKAASLLGVSLSTMYRWLKSGKITASFRTFGNHRRFLFSDISKISKPFENNNDHKPVIAYARVSTHKQKNDLENQKQYLHNYCVEKKFKNFEIISDLGSGLNFNKKGLNKLIDLISNQSISKLILTYKDRLLRFGSEIIFKLCKFFHIEVIIINNKENKSSEQELSEDLCEILTVFSARLYGKRSHKNIVKPIQQTSIN